MEVSEPFQSAVVDKLQTHLRRVPKWRMNIKKNYKNHKYLQSRPVAEEHSSCWVNTSELWTILEHLHFASDLAQRALSMKDR